LAKTLEIIKKRIGNILKILCFSLFSSTQSIFYSYILLINFSIYWGLMRKDDFGSELCLRKQKECYRSV